MRRIVIFIGKKKKDLLVVSPTKLYSLAIESHHGSAGSRVIQDKFRLLRANSILNFVKMLGKEKNIVLFIGECGECTIFKVDVDFVFKFTHPNFNISNVEIGRHLDLKKRRKKLMEKQRKPPLYTLEV